MWIDTFIFYISWQKLWYLWWAATPGRQFWTIARAWKGHLSGMALKSEEEVIKCVFHFLATIQRVKEFPSPDRTRPSAIPPLPVLQVQQIPHSQMRKSSKVPVSLRRRRVSSNVLRSQQSRARGEGHRLLLAHVSERWPERYSNLHSCYVQGDHSACSKPPVDIDLKVAI